MHSQTRFRPHQYESALRFVHISLIGSRSTRGFVSPPRPVHRFYRERADNTEPTDRTARPGCKRRYTTNTFLPPLHPPTNSKYSGTVQTH